MRKHFVLSTRTLVSKRNVTQSFGSDNTIYVPLAVMEESSTNIVIRLAKEVKLQEKHLSILDLSITRIWKKELYRKMVVS